MANQTIKIKTLSTVNVNADQLNQVCENDNYYIPLTINKNEYVNKFADPSGSIYGSEESFLRHLDFAINVNGGEVENIVKHLKMNGFDVEMVGATTPEEFLKNLSEHSEINRELYK